jgi:hypothetical protein
LDDVQKSRERQHDERRDTRVSMVKRVKAEWADSVPATHQAFRPYVTAIGQLTVAWNDLHVTLSLLFCTVMGGGFINKYLSIWQAIPNDRTQRAILLAAAQEDQCLGKHAAPELYDRLKWVMDKATEVEDVRNTCLHSPIWGYKRSDNEVIVMPITGLGHIRARRLFERNLLAEFRWCRDAAIILRNYAAELDEAMKRGIGPWPAIPKWPDHGATKISRQQPRQAPKAKPPRRAKPSSP